MAEDKQSTCLERIATGTMAYFITCEVGIAKCFCPKCQSKKTPLENGHSPKAAFETPCKM